MDAEHQAAFKALENQAKSHGGALKSISECTEEIKNHMHGQAMALQEVAHQRELCRAQMEKEVGDVSGKAEEAESKAELAHVRVTGLKRAAWGLVVLALAQLIGLLVWLVKSAVTAGAGG